MHGGKAKNEKIAAHKSAVLLRGGMFPLAYVYPAELRATRDLLRRRWHLARKRAELLAHIHNTNSQYNLPESGKRLANKSTRQDVAEHFPDPSVRKAIEVDVSLIDHYDQLLGEVELYLTRSAKTDDIQTFARLQSVPGIGQILALVILYAIPDIQRFPRVQDFVSYCRLVKCAKESNGKRLGTAGKTIGNVHLRWAVAEAAVLFIRQSQPGKDYFAQLEHQHGKATALTVCAHKLGRAVYYLRTREHAFDLQRFVSASPLRRETEPVAELANNGESPFDIASFYTARTVWEYLDDPPEPDRLIGRSLSLLCVVMRHQGSRGCPSTESGTHEACPRTQPTTLRRPGGGHTRVARAWPRRRPLLSTHKVREYRPSRGVWRRPRAVTSTRNQVSHKRFGMDDSPHVTRTVTPPPRCLCLPA
jgi:transposase